jgi:ribonuclease-3
MKNLNQLEKSLGVNFKNKALLTQSFIHRSFLNENPESHLSSNERLEFLGDAILSFVISTLLYSRFPRYQEGDLTNLRSKIVRTTSLAQIAQKLNLGNYLIMGKGEEESGGKKKPSLLANSVEALIGAIYLDQEIEVVEKFIKKEFSFLIKKFAREPRIKDYKSTLQEQLQARTKEAPKYQTLKTLGPAHARTFVVGVYLKRKILAQGKGASKQEAEQQAAKIALEKSKKE